MANFTDLDIASARMLPPDARVQAGLKKISTIVVKFKKGDENAPEVILGLPYLDDYLRWLEYECQMTPALKRYTAPGLEHMFNPAFKMPVEWAERARRIFNKFEADLWGKNDIVTTDSASESDEEAPARIRQQAPSDPRAPPTALSPPANHPIWGTRGIMHGLAFFTDGKKKLNPEFLHEKRVFKVFGHNGLYPGQWFPNRQVALFHGAHGATQAGISGNVDLGAWSIVISGHYDGEGMDEDHGDTLIYASDDALHKSDITKGNARSGRSLSLTRSLETGNPVRVLRSAGTAGHGDRPWAPQYGIRYDGLYKVTHVETAFNKDRRRFDKFTLERQPNQRSLREIIATVPSQAQIRDYHKINEGY